MLIPKESQKHDKKRYSPLVKKYLRQTGDNAKLAIIHTLFLAVYIVIGAFVFFYLEDCRKYDKIQTDKVIHKENVKSFDKFLGKYCNNNDTSIEKIKEVIFSVGNCSNGVWVEKIDLQQPLRSRECKETDRARIEKWLLHSFVTVHALGYGEILQTNSSKLAVIFYSLFGLIISSTAYIKLGASVLSSFKLVVVLIDLKLSKQYNKRRINYLYCKSLLFNILSLITVIFVSSLTTSSMNENRTNLLDHVTSWWFTILTIGSRDLEIYQHNSIVVLFMFTFVGITFLSATIWNVCQVLGRFHQRNNKKRGRKRKSIITACCCCCFGSKEGAEKEDVGALFKDVGTQKWGSLMSINNASNIELRSMDGSMRGNVFENSNRVDSQCTIKRLSEIEKDRGHRGNEDNSSGSDYDDNEADDELGVLSPIMVTAAVATRRTVNDLS